MFTVFRIRAVIINVTRSLGGIIKVDMHLRRLRSPPHVTLTCTPPPVQTADMYRMRKHYVNDIRVPEFYVPVSLSLSAVIFIPTFPPQECCILYVRNIIEKSLRLCFMKSCVLYCSFLCLQ